MAKNRKPPKDKRRRSPRPQGVSVRRDESAAAWLLVHPRCARERADDLEEVQAMIEAGEAEIAIEELRWLLSGCSDFIEAHYLLAMLAWSEDNDLPLARAHFGYAYQLGLTALRRAKMPRPLPYRLPANQPFFEAGKGLARCLREQGKTKMALEVVDMLLELDPTNPLGLAELRRAITK